MASHSNKNKKNKKRKIKDLTTEELLGEQPFYSSYIEKPKSRNSSIEELLREQPFYKAPIKKQKSKKLPNQELLQVLPFYDSAGITKKDRAFRNHVSRYSVEIMDRERLIDILVLSITSINELFTDLFREKSGFKYFITVRVTLKRRLNNGFDVRRPHFNSAIKPVIND